MYAAMIAAYSNIFKLIKTGSNHCLGPFYPQSCRRPRYRTAAWVCPIL